jgi:hypothetical protein
MLLEKGGVGGKRDQSNGGQRSGGYQARGQDKLGVFGHQILLL